MMKDFSEARILNTIKQHWNFSKEDVINALDEALNRGLLTQQQIDEQLAHLPSAEEVEAKEYRIRKTKKKSTRNYLLLVLALLIYWIVRAYFKSKI